MAGKLSKLRKSRKKTLIHKDYYTFFLYVCSVIQLNAMTQLRKTFLFLFLLCFVSIQAEVRYHTQSFNNQVKTLRITEVNGEQLIRPILFLNDNRQLEISFDELSHDPHFYSYTVIHCNADWTPSDLHSSEYLQGFTSLDIQDYEFSSNTTQIYTHYRFEIPNLDMNLMLSGNYAVLIYEDGDKDQLVATACFSVVEPLGDINAQVRSNTLIEFNGRYQQLDINIALPYSSSQLASETQLVIHQNNRTDNMRIGIKPTYVNNNQLTYTDNRALIFEGGNEYRRFDLASLYITGHGVEHINYDHTHYHALISPNNTRHQHAYISDQDVNGQYLIHAERVANVDTEADYIWVHFFLPQDAPFFDGNLFIGGDFTHNQLHTSNKMLYDNKEQAYIYSTLLKQGGYNYQYWFQPKGQIGATLLRTEGSHWQTQNEYSIYLYHRPFGQRYDRLIAYKSIFSNP